jgi:hypothetical protein
MLKSYALALVIWILISSFSTLEIQKNLNYEFSHCNKLWSLCTWIINLNKGNSIVQTEKDDKLEND